jgi:small-conductance mechanosensitive channel/CRP-like cAMP-binding protein
MKSPRMPLLLRRLIGSILTLAFVLAVLWSLSAAGLLSDQMKKSYGALAIGIACALLATRLLQYLIFDLLFQFRRHVAAPQLLRQLVGLVIFGFGIALAVKVVFPNAHLGALFTTSAILTAVVGLALHDTLGNLFAGIALHLGRTVQVGDIIHSGETYGTIEELSWRAIKLRTVEGNILLIPNSVAGRERLEIYPRPGPPIARNLRVGLEYDASPAHAREVLEAAVRHAPGVAAFPPPTAYLKSFESYSVLYELRYWLEDYSRFLDVDSAVRERVWYALDRARLPIAYPLIRQHQWAAGALPQRSRLDEIAAAIERLDLFAPLSVEARRRVAEGAHDRRYAPGEVIVREGDRTSSMFVIDRGRAAVTLHGHGPDSRKIAVLEPGAAFGEASLLTGEPRSATVRALEETIVIEIGKETLAPILLEAPGLCTALEATMRERERHRADAVEQFRSQVLPPPSEPPLAERIARFFGLGG